MKHKQRGAVTIVEATFVFPIMFIVVFALLMACEAYYQYARVEKACIQAALDGAARCENPMLEEVQASGQVPTSTSAVPVRPYRYILTSEAKAIAESVARELENQVEGLGVLAFRGMTPTRVQVTATPHMNVLVSSFQVTCSFDIRLPIRMLFTSENITFHYTVQVSQSVGDPAEFVRNVSMIGDFLERSALGAKIEEFIAPLQSAMDKLANFIN